MAEKFTLEIALPKGAQCCAGAALQPVPVLQQVYVEAARRSFIGARADMPLPA